MVAIYVRWILAGKITVEEVPDRWRSQVAERLKLIQEVGE